MIQNNLSIIGGSGHAKVVIDLAELLNYRIERIFDLDEGKNKILSYNINHSFDNIPVNTIVAIGNNIIRKKIAINFSLIPPYLIHPSCNLSKYATIGEGSVVMSGVSINVDAKIGKHCILNTNCSVDHDCVIHDYVHISPNASLAGNVEIGEGSHIGIGACVIQGVKIGKWCTIGAGAVIIRNIEDGTTIVGNPGRKI